MLVAVALVLIFVVPAGWEAPRSTMGDPLQTCRRLQLSAARCDAPIEQAIKQADRRAVGHIRVELGRPDGDKISIGGYLVAVVRLHMVNGPTIDEAVSCIGIGDGHRGWCNDLTSP